mmetsp:Transcript_14679/g.35428  ORF Transcript_14679/g.35428 Transcript_14679/m.35428 type:complete len:85 (+) Transcript_14679:2137-2391(+)
MCIDSQAMVQRVHQGFILSPNNMICSELYRSEGSNHTAYQVQTIAIAHDKDDEDKRHCPRIKLGEVQDAVNMFASLFSAPARTL